MYFDAKKAHELEYAVKNPLRFLCEELFIKHRRENLVLKEELVTKILRKLRQNLT